MPNAQTHLAAVCELIETQSRVSTAPSLAAKDVQSSFLLGAISPDVRAISGQRREETHFFTIPPADASLAEDIMLQTWPGLRSENLHAGTQAAFIAGYMCHLAMDQIWVDRIVMPHLFSEGHQWGTNHPNWRLYSILMTYLEYRAERRFPSDGLELLARATPDHWLPFVEDRYLIKWRDYVVEMIRTDGARRTSELFARSNGFSASELEDIVLSDQRMAAEVFPTVSQGDLAEFEKESARRSYEVVLGYLTPT